MSHAANFDGLQVSPGHLIIMDGRSEMHSCVLHSQAKDVINNLTNYLLEEKAKNLPLLTLKQCTNSEGGRASEKGILLRSTVVGRNELTTQLVVRCLGQPRLNWLNKIEWYTSL